MSDAKKTTEEEAAPAPSKAKSKLLMLVGIGVLVLALVAGGGIYMMMHKKAPADDEDVEEVVEEAPSHKNDKKEPPVFVKLDTFTVRLQNEAHDSYLQAMIELRVLDIHLAEQVKQYNPEIRHKALLVMASKTPEELNKPEGVEALAVELRDTINMILAPPPPKKKSKKKEVAAESSDHVSPSAPVQAVLFTSFIVQ